VHYPFSLPQKEYYKMEVGTLGSTSVAYSRSLVADGVDRVDNIGCGLLGGRITTEESSEPLAPEMKFYPSQHNMQRSVKQSSEVSLNFCVRSSRRLS